MATHLIDPKVWLCHRLCGCPALTPYPTANCVTRFCLGAAPANLQELCRFALGAQGYRAFLSSTQGELLVPHEQMAIRQHCDFSVVGLGIICLKLSCLGFTQMRFIAALRPSLSARLGLEHSSLVEGAPCKSS